MDIDNYKEIKLAELEKENTKNKNIINDLLIANKKLIQKNEELKEKIKKYSNIIEQDTKDFVKLNQAFNKIDLIAEGNLCDIDYDVCPENCKCDWKNVIDIIKKVKE